jgi:short-subunit dehydrogenase
LPGAPPRRATGRARAGTKIASDDDDACEPVRCGEGRCNLAPARREDAMSRPTTVTLVTGASAGIGRELARLAAPDSGTLVIVARRRDRLEALADELVKANPGLAVVPWACDLVDPAERRALIAGLAAKGLAVDVLINNAGVGDTGSFHDLDARRLASQLELNVTAVHDLLLALVPGMVARRRGRILNVASTAGFQPLPWMATYAAAKAFVLHLSEALAVELRPHGVTVTCLCPGRTATEFFEAAQGHSEIPFAKMPTASVHEVAERGYRGMLAGRAVVVPKLRDRLLGVAGRVSPRQLALLVSGRLFRPGARE